MHKKEPILSVSHSWTKSKMVTHILVFRQMTALLVNDESVWSPSFRSSRHYSPNVILVAKSRKETGTHPLTY